jgi:hypothetical protein
MSQVEFIDRLVRLQAMARFVPPESLFAEVLLLARDLFEGKVDGKPENIVTSSG